MLLSVIVAAYNAEKYIQECMESILSQVDNDVEVIVINDGSNDSTLDILEQMNREYSFVLLNQENRGVAYTRNRGLKFARGGYITFLDSDDVWENNSYALIKKAAKSNSDCLVFNYKEWTPNDLKIKIAMLPNSLSIEQSKITLAEQSLWYLWRMVFKREIYQGSFFEEGRRFEDQLLLPKLINRCQTVLISNDSLVKYRFNTDSITNSLNSNDVIDSFYCLVKYIEEYRDRTNNLYYSKVISNIYISHVSKCARVYHQDKKIALKLFRDGNKMFRFKIAYYAGNKKALAYYMLRYVLFYRLVKSVKKEVNV